MSYRLAVAAGLALLLAAPDAHAEDPLVGTVRKVASLWTDSQEGEIRRKIAQASEQVQTALAVTNAFLANNHPTDIRIDMFAELGAGVDRRAAAGEGTLGALFAIQGERCDLIQIGASLRGDLRSDESRPMGGAQQWGHLCLAGGLDLRTLMQLDAPGLVVFPMTLRESGVLSARPRLTAKRSAIDERYSDIGFGFDVEGLRYMWAKERGVGAVGFTADQKWRWRGWPGGDDAKIEIQGDFWFARLFRTRGEDALADRFIDILTFGFHGIQSDNGAAIVAVWPVRFYGIGFGDNDSVLVDADLGAAGTGTVGSSIEGPGVMSMTTIESTGLPHVTAAVAHVAVHAGGPHQYISVAYDRTLDTNVLADVIREDRFTLSGELTNELVTARGAAFASRSRYYLNEASKADERVAGISFTGTYALSYKLALGVTLEGVLGLVERDPLLDGHALPRGVRAFATLSTTRTLWSLY
jgi:hypothetical protein